MNKTGMFRSWSDLALCVAMWVLLGVLVALPFVLSGGGK